MFHSLTRRFEHNSRLFGLFLAVIALMGQVAVGSVAPAQNMVAEQARALEAVLILCHSDNGSTPSQPNPLHHHTDCALCPLCQVLAHYNVVLTGSPPLPTPSTSMTMRARGVPTARAPPAPILVSAYPRGPPSLA
jgi:hypothetical protein